MLRGGCRRPLLSVERSLDTLGQFLGRPFTPKVRENESRLLADHMVMQRYNMDACFSQSLQHGLHFLGGHDEIAVHGSQLVAPRESRPGGESHGAADLYVVHASFASDRYLDHAFLRLTLLAQDLLNGGSVNVPSLGRLTGKMR